MIHPDLLHIKEVLKLLLEEVATNKEYDCDWYKLQIYRANRKFFKRSV